eukprot:1148392-Pelagomonas_calceolata.AAC.3
MDAEEALGLKQKLVRFGWGQVAVPSITRVPATMVLTWKWSSCPRWKQALPVPATFRGPVSLPFAPYIVSDTFAFVEAPLTSLVLTMICSSMTK